MTSVYLASLVSIFKLVVLDILPGLSETGNDNRSGLAGMGQKEMIRELDGQMKCSTNVLSKSLNFHRPTDH